MSEASERLEEAIHNIEIFFWDDNENEESGKKLFKHFAKTHESLFKKANISNSTENKFEYLPY